MIVRQKQASCMTPRGRHHQTDFASVMSTDFTFKGPAPFLGVEMSDKRDSQTNLDLDAVTIRSAGADDEATLRRLADLDSTRVPDGPVLMAEIGGQAGAAVSVASGDSFADPFVPTLELRRLLELRASQLHLSSTEEPGRRGLGKPDYSASRTMGRRLALASSSRRTGVV